MSIQIGSKVKIKDDVEASWHNGATGTVTEVADDWEWAVQLDSDPDSVLGYNSDELEVIQ